MKKLYVDEIFGIVEGKLSRVSGMELLCEAEDSSKGIKYGLYRDEKGQHYIAAEGGKHACIGSNSLYRLDNRQIYLPVTPETVRLWAQQYADPGCSRLWDGFPEEDAFTVCKTVWRFGQGTEEGQPGYIREVLMKTEAGIYKLYTTAVDYPLCFESTTWISSDTDGTGIFADVYVHHVTPETARRWAKARGMDDNTCKDVFGVD